MLSLSYSGFRYRHTRSAGLPPEHPSQQFPHGLVPAGSHDPIGLEVGPFVGLLVVGLEVGGFVGLDVGFCVAATISPGSNMLTTALSLGMRNHMPSSLVPVYSSSLLLTQ